MQSNYWSSLEVSQNIKSEMSSMESSIISNVQSSLSSEYLDSSETSSLLSSELQNYYTIADSDSNYIDNSELANELQAYPTINHVGTLMSDYVTETVSDVGLSGLYDDLIGTPDFVSQNQFEDFKGIYLANNYISTSSLEQELSTVTNDMMTVMRSIESEIVSDHVSVTELDEYGFAVKDELAKVASTNSYTDLDDLPNFDEYLTTTQIEELYVSVNSLIDGDMRSPMTRSNLTIAWVWGRWTQFVPNSFHK